MTAKTCGTCKSYNPDRMWCEFVLPISIVNHTRHMMYLNSKYPPCPAHTERESFCEWTVVEKYSNGLTMFKKCVGTKGFFEIQKYCSACGKKVKVEELNNLVDGKPIKIKENEE